MGTVFLDGVQCVCLVRESRRWTPASLVLRCPRAAWPCSGGSAGRGPTLFPPFDRCGWRPVGATVNYSWESARAGCGALCEGSVAADELPLTATPSLLHAWRVGRLLHAPLRQHVERLLQAGCTVERACSHNGIPPMLFRTFSASSGVAMPTARR